MDEIRSIDDEPEFSDNEFLVDHPDDVGYAQGDDFEPALQARLAFVHQNQLDDSLMHSLNVSLSADHLVADADVGEALAPAAGENGVAAIANRDPQGRVNGKYLAICVPRSGQISPEALFESFVLGFPSKIQAFGCVWESHEAAAAGGHLHIFVEFRKKQQTPFAKLTDVIGKSGHYQLVRDIRAYITYMLKDQDAPTKAFEGLWRDWNGTEYIVCEPLDLIRGEGKKGIASAIASLLLGNPYCSGADLIAVNPGYCMLHSRAIETFRRRLIDMRSAPTKSWADWNRDTPAQFQFAELYAWAADFVKKVQIRKLHQPLTNGVRTEIVKMKSNVTVFHGPPDNHKTSFMLHMRKYVDCLWLTANEDFPFNGITIENCPDVVVFEDFKWNKWSYESWQRLVDAGPYQVNNDKGSALRLPQRLQFVFLQNQDPAAWWKIPRENGNPFERDEMHDLLIPMHRAAFEARLWRVFHIDSPLVGFADPNLENFVVDMDL